MGGIFLSGEVNEPISHWWGGEGIPQSPVWNAAVFLYTTSGTKSEKKLEVTFF